MEKRTKIMLTADERKELERFSTTGTHSVRLVKRARVILALDESEGRKRPTQAEIAELVGVSRQAVNVAKRDFLAAGAVSAFLLRKKRETPPVPAKITGELEARIVALVCGPVPEGCARWSLRLLADKCVELKYIDSLSHSSVQRVLKKLNSSLI